MPSVLTNKFSKTLKLIGWYQIIGGIIGILIIAYEILISDRYLLPSVIIYSLASTLFAYSIYCGLLCVENKEKSIIFSLINQILQTLGFFIGGYAFSFSAGLFLFLGFDATNEIQILFNLGLSQFQINYNTQVPTTQIYVNLIALFLVFRITKLKQDINAEKLSIIEQTL